MGRIGSSLWRLCGHHGVARQVSSSSLSALHGATARQSPRLRYLRICPGNHAAGGSAPRLVK